MLDNVLLAGAWEAGAHVLLGTSVHDVTRDGAGRVTGVTASPSEGGAPMTIRAKLVVGADGIRSRVARAVEAPDIEAFVPDTGALFSYFDGIAWDGVELFASEGMFAGIFPTNDDAACVWVMSTADVIDAIRAEHGSAPLDFERVTRALAPELADRIAGPAASSGCGSGRYPSFVRQAAGPGWALVGDAGYFRDPITGHGITDAFRDAELLARATRGMAERRVPEHASPSPMSLRATPPCARSSRSPTPWPSGPTWRSSSGSRSSSPGSATWRRRSWRRRPSSPGAPPSRRRETDTMTTTATTKPAALAGAPPPFRGSPAWRPTDL